VQLDLEIPDFSTPDGPGRLGADPATVARTADEAGFDFIAVMDHFLQIRAIGPPEREMHYQLERPLNSPQALTRPHPPIMIGGCGGRKTLRLVARYADACNLFQTPDLARKLDVLRALRRRGPRLRRDHQDVLLRLRRRREGREGRRGDRPSRPPGRDGLPGRHRRGGPRLAGEAARADRRRSHPRRTWPLTWPGPTTSLSQRRTPDDMVATTTRVRAEERRG